MNIIALDLEDHLLSPLFFEVSCCFFSTMPFTVFKVTNNDCASISCGKPAAIIITVIPHARSCGLVDRNIPRKALSAN